MAKSSKNKQQHKGIETSKRAKSPPKNKQQPKGQEATKEQRKEIKRNIASNKKSTELSRPSNSTSTPPSHPLGKSKPASSSTSPVTPKEAFLELLTRVTSVFKSDAYLLLFCPTLLICTATLGWGVGIFSVLIWLPPFSGLIGTSLGPDFWRERRYWRKKKGVGRKEGRKKRGVKGKMGEGQRIVGKWEGRKGEGEKEEEKEEEEKEEEEKKKEKKATEKKEEKNETTESVKKKVENLLLMI